MVGCKEPPEVDEERELVNELEEDALVSEEVDKLEASVELLPDTDFTVVGLAMEAKDIDGWETEAIAVVKAVVPSDKNCSGINWCGVTMVALVDPSRAEGVISCLPTMTGWELEMKSKQTIRETISLKIGKHTSEKRMRQPWGNK